MRYSESFDGADPPFRRSRNSKTFGLLIHPPFRRVQNQKRLGSGPHQARNYRLAYSPAGATVMPLVWTF